MPRCKYMQVLCNLATLQPVSLGGLQGRGPQLSQGCPPGHPLNRLWMRRSSKEQEPVEDDRHLKSPTQDTTTRDRPPLSKHRLSEAPVLSHSRHSEGTQTLNRNTSQVRLLYDFDDTIRYDTRV